MTCRTSESRHGRRASSVTINLIERQCYKMNGRELIDAIEKADALDMTVVDAEGYEIEDAEVETREGPEDVFRVGGPI